VIIHAAGLLCPPAVTLQEEVLKGLGVWPANIHECGSVAVFATLVWVLQEGVLERCRGVWPERFRHGYAHFAGPMIEEFFFTCVHAFGTINTSVQFTTSCIRQSYSARSAHFVPALEATCQTIRGSSTFGAMHC
jgi:hypothetical protein